MPISQDVLDRYNKLPSDLKKILNSAATSDRIFEIGRKHSLSIDKIGVLGQEIGSVILGEKPASKFIDNLKNALDIDRDKTREIAEDVNHQIFYEIRENLKKLHGV